MASPRFGNGGAKGIRQLDDTPLSDAPISKGLVSGLKGLRKVKPAVRAISDAPPMGDWASLPAPRRPGVIAKPRTAASRQSIVDASDQAMARRESVATAGRNQAASRRATLHEQYNARPPARPNDFRTGSGFRKGLAPTNGRTARRVTAAWATPRSGAQSIKRKLSMEQLSASVTAPVTKSLVRTGLNGGVSSFERIPAKLGKLTRKTSSRPDPYAKPARPATVKPNALRPVTWGKSEEFGKTRSYDPEHRRQQRLGAATAVLGIGGLAAATHGGKGAVKTTKLVRGLETRTQVTPSGASLTGNNSRANARHRKVGEYNFARRAAMASGKDLAFLGGGTAAVGAAGAVQGHANSRRGKAWD
jgi:hypothetical protein